MGILVIYKQLYYQ